MGSLRTSDTKPTFSSSSYTCDRGSRIYYAKSGETPQITAQTSALAGGVRGWGKWSGLDLEVIGTTAE